MEYTHETHVLEAWFDNEARVLILGTLPSPKSREYGCYYGHPQNRFWRTVAAVYDEAVPQTVAERRNFARRHHMALWDVLASCDICGAQDSSIRNATPNDLSRILTAADIRAVFTTGQKAKQLYDRLIYPTLAKEAVALPSTSPANCAVGFEKLVEAYGVLKRYTDDL